MALIRLACAADAAGMLAIYAPYIENTSVTFETEVPTAEAFAERISHYLEHWPWLVCEINGQLAGYAYASRYRERVAYQWSVECSVYVHDDFQRRAVARALYSVLFPILQRQGFRNVYAVINLPNEKSVAFHERMGFRHFATYEQVGYKLGRWKNVGWWRLILNEFGDEPGAPVLFNQLDKDFLPGLFTAGRELLKS
ncbi:MAG: N-acetyltransferase [Sphingobacteriales bacterium]|nr:N-acetyltransferase [Sphingobacteriales bacterium]